MPGKHKYVRSPPNVCRLLYTRLIVLIHLSAYRIPRGPIQVLQDNVSFGEMLGRVHSLQYQHFRHFEVFEAMLRSEFKQSPGAQKVLSGQYNILNAVNHGLIAKDTWPDKVFPGTKLVMSAIVDSLKNRPGFCPRLGCDGRVSTAKNTDKMICPDCNLIVYSSYRDGDLSIHSRSIEESQGNRQAQSVIELSQLPWLRQLRCEADHDRKSSSQNKSAGTTAEMALQHASRPTVVDTVSRINPNAAKQAIKVDGSVSEKPEKLDREQQEMALFRRIHISPVPSFDLDELYDVYKLGSAVYVSQGSRWRAYKVHWKGRTGGLALQVHCKYSSHKADEESLHPSYVSFILSPFQGSKRLTDLTLIPAAMHPNDDVLRKGLIKRGWQYWDSRKLNRLS